MNADIKKRGLGRGLDALFRDVKSEDASFQPRVKRADEMVAASQALRPDAAAATPAASAAGGPPRRLPVERLTPGKYQPRRHFDDAAIDQLAESIGVHGVLQPLLVRPLSANMYEIVAGERRWRAAQKAQVHDLPVVIRDLTDKEAMEIALIENLQREDLSAVEEADGYQRLIDEFGHTQDMLAQQIGKSRSHVANTLRLLKLPAPVRKMIQSGMLSAGHARALVGARNPEELAGLIVKRSLSVRQTEKLVQQATEGKLKSPAKKIKGFAQKDVDLLALEQKLTTTLGMKVTVEGAGASGKLVVEYKTLDQLDDIIARLSVTPRRGH